MRFRRLIRQVHRWLGLLIGLQLLFWVVGGVVMSALRMEEVRGDHLAAHQAAPVISADAALLAPWELLQRHAAQRPIAIELTSWLDRPVYRLRGEAGTLLIDAVTGDALSPIPQALAEAVARADYVGDGQLIAVEWVEQPGTEYRGRELPLWRMRFDDALATTLYVSPSTGAVIARRNTLWRVFDFVWMLHIMDYDEREDFNHPLLIVTAATALLFVGSGLAMLFYSFMRRSARPQA
jgi:hypothetical protein